MDLLSDGPAPATCSYGDHLALLTIAVVSALGFRLDRAGRIRRPAIVRVGRGRYSRAMRDAPVTTPGPVGRRGALEIVPSVCPHDCTSTCALDVERLDARTIGRVRGSTRNTYTAGVICEKVGRYAERIHHPDRLLHPLRRVGPKGSAQFARISWEEALDRVAEAFAEKAARHGSETVWPYFYAGAHTQSKAGQQRGVVVVEGGSGPTSTSRAGLASTR
jgi:anaerobic selenocysteine-containing dehydrogenase